MEGTSGRQSHAPFTGVWRRRSLAWFLVSLLRKRRGVGGAGDRGARDTAPRPREQGRQRPERTRSGARHGGRAGVNRQAPWWAARATESKTYRESPRHGCSFFECRWQTSIRRILVLTCRGRKIVMELISSNATSDPAR